MWWYLQLCSFALLGAAEEHICRHREASTSTSTSSSTQLAVVGPVSPSGESSRHRADIRVTDIRAQDVPRSIDEVEQGHEYRKATYAL
ncbi:hypothetical protein FOPE_07753 [Fonsecaea pedrosoi]|nr:hypothetical protein FOPE_07753 [Fonsecaea pedrosoi]